MVSPKPRPPNRRPLFIPILILPMVMFSSYFLIRPPTFAQLDKNTSSVDVDAKDESMGKGNLMSKQPKLKGSTEKADSSIRQPTNGALPDYLIITFDSAYYNTNMLKECMTTNARIGDSPLVYAPLISYTDVSLNTQMIHQYMKHHNHSVTAATFDVFPYPTNRSGVIFNSKALQLWMKEVRCYVATNNNSSSFVPSPVTYDRRAQAVEYQLCKIVKERVPTKNTNIFESALIKTLQLSLSIQSKS